MQNTTHVRRNSSPYGVGVKKNGSSFTAYIGVSGERKYLGIFKSVEEAQQARAEAKAIYHN